MSIKRLNQRKILKKSKSPWGKSYFSEEINSINLNPSIRKPIFKESNWFKPKIILKAKLNLQKININFRDKIKMLKQRKDSNFVRRRLSKEINFQLKKFNRHIITEPRRK